MEYVLFSVSVNELAIYVIFNLIVKSLAKLSQPLTFVEMN